LPLTFPSCFDGNSAHLPPITSLPPPSPASLQQHPPPSAFNFVIYLLFIFSISGESFFRLLWADLPMGL
jgi:hypothetical protein